MEQQALNFTAMKFNLFCSHSVCDAASDALHIGRSAVPHSCSHSTSAVIVCSMCVRSYY